MDLHYKEFGKGRVLVILHGLFGISDNWVSVAKKLSADFKVILIDQRNHGRSPNVNTHTYDDLTKDLFEFLNQKSFSKVSIIGHSMGGKVAMNFALRYPQMVDKLVIEDIAPTSTKNSDVIYLKKLLEFISGIDIHSYKSRKQIEKLIYSNITNINLAQLFVKNVFWADKNKLGWRINIPVIKDYLDVIFDEIEVDIQSDINCLFVKGEYSNYITEDNLKDIDKCFINNTVKVILNSGHWVHVDQPKEFVSIVNEFLLNK